MLPLTQRTASDSEPRPRQYGVDAVRTTANEKAAGRPQVLAQLAQIKKIRPSREVHHSDIRREGGGVRSRGNELSSRPCTITDERTQRGNYRSIVLVARVGKVLLRVVDHCLSDSCKGETKRPEQQCVFSSPAVGYRRDTRHPWVAGSCKGRDDPPMYEVCASLTYRRRATPSIVPFRIVLAWRMA